MLPFGAREIGCAALEAPIDYTMALGLIFWVDAGVTQGLRVDLLVWHGLLRPTLPTESTSRPTIKQLYLLNPRVNIHPHILGLLLYAFLQLIIEIREVFF